VSTVLFVVPASEAESVACVFTFTRSVVTVKVADTAPAGTVTLAGTRATLLLLERATAAPPAGAATLKVTVPLVLLPPRILVGFTVRAVSDTCEAIGSQVKSTPVRSGPTVTDCGGLLVKPVRLAETV
jgi:hypothetical protein